MVALKATANQMLHEQNAKQQKVSINLDAT